MKKQFFTALLAGSVLMGGAAFAEEMGAKEKRGLTHEKKMQEKTDEFLDAVDATDAQKVQIRAIENKYRAQMLSMEQDEMRAKNDLMNYVFSTNATEAEAVRRQEQLLQSRQRAEELMLRAAFEKKAVLTPEQQREASQYFTEKSREKLEDKAEDLEDKAEDLEDKAEEIEER